MLTVIKLVHTAIFFLLAACVLYILFCALSNRYSRRTSLAIALIFIEGIVLVLNDWECPLTTLAQRVGAAQGGVADIFLPRILADHLFEICTPLFVCSTLLLLIRRLRA